MINNFKKYISINLLSSLGWISLLFWVFVLIDITFLKGTFSSKRIINGIGLMFNFGIQSLIFAVLLILWAVEYSLKKFFKYKFQISINNSIYIFCFEMGLMLLTLPLFFLGYVMFQNIFVWIVLFLGIFIYLKKGK